MCLSMVVMTNSAGKLHNKAFPHCIIRLNRMEAGIMAHTLCDYLFQQLLDSDTLLTCLSSCSCHKGKFMHLLCIVVLKN